MKKFKKFTLEKARFIIERLRKADEFYSIYINLEGKVEIDGVWMQSQPEIFYNATFGEYDLKCVLSRGEIYNILSQHYKKDQIKQMAQVLNEKLAELREIEDNKDSDIRELEIMEDKKLYKILSRYEKDMKGLTEEESRELLVKTFKFLYNDFKGNKEYNKILFFIENIPLSNNMFEIFLDDKTIYLVPYLDSFVKYEYSSIKIQVIENKNTLGMFCKKTYTDIGRKSNKSERTINGDKYYIVRSYSLNYYVSANYYAVIVPSFSDYKHKSPRMLSFYKDRRLVL